MRIKVKLQSTESPYFYTNTKKKKNVGDKVGKLSFKKYDPVKRKHVIFKEEKL